MSRRNRVYAVRGGSLKSFLSSVNNFLKKHKIVSTVGRALAPAIPIAGQIGNAAAAFGYGRRRRTRRKRFLGVGRRRTARRRGTGALRLAGGAVRRTRMRRTYY